MHSKGNYRQGEKTTLRMGENNSKWNNWQRINLQNIQAAHIPEKQTTQSKIGGKDLNRHFFKEDTQVANKHMKRCSTFIIIKAMQIKSTIGYHLTPIRMPLIKKSISNNAGKGVEKREHSCTVGGNVNWDSCYWRLYGNSLKTRNNTTIWASNPTLRHIPWRNQNERNMYPIIHCNTIHNS